LTVEIELNFILVALSGEIYYLTANL